MANTIFAVLLVALVLVRFLTEDYLKKSKVTLVLLVALTVMCGFRCSHTFTNWRICASWGLAALAFVVICFNVWLGIKEHTNIEDECDKDESKEKETVKAENAETFDFDDDWFEIKNHTNIEDECDRDESDEEKPVKVENAETVSFEDLEQVDE